ncbi:MAG: hypothetical protein AB1610_05725 [Nitrospirota bacterium]
MKSIAWRSIVITIATFLFCSSAFADGSDAWLNINYTNTETFEEGEKTGSSDSLYQNYYFSFNKSLTPVISYQLYLRTSLTDTASTDTNGDTTSTYSRTAEPAFDIFLRNPVYGISTGYRRTEQWTSASLRDETRDTTEFYYSRFDLMPRDFPSLFLQFDRQEIYDYLSVSETDTATTKYSASSSYNLLYEDIKLAYNLTFTRSEDETPLSTITKTINNSYNGSYNLGYNKSLWNNKVNIVAGYQGNYSYSEVEQFSTETGSVSFERSASSGMYGGPGTSITPNVDVLSPVFTLTDDDYNTPAGTINIGQNGSAYHNIGIQLFSSQEPVDTLYIYVNKDITSDTTLTNPSSWSVSYSDFNQSGTWTDITIQNITVSAYDISNNIYRYEIEFAAPQYALFFRVINLDNATINDVLVTEIEAYGTDEISETGKTTDISTFFTQGINFSTTVRPSNTLTFSLNYFLNRSDQNPESALDSMTGAFSNIFSNSITGKEDMQSNVTRTYGVGSTWLTHRLLTTSARFQRNESFDNSNETDYSSNTYSLDFSSSPLPTLDTRLSLVKTSSYSFGEKESESNLYLFTTGAKLYKDVNLIVDLGYTQAETFSTDAESEDTESEDAESESYTKYIRGRLDARLTSRLSTNFSYGFSETSGDETSTSIDGTAVVTYRVGSFMNVSGNYKISDTDGDISTSEGVLLDWRFLPTIKFNLSYQHSRTEPEPTTTDSFSGYTIWNITKFLDLQLAYNYSCSTDETEEETYSYSGSLNCRFW